MVSLRNATAETAESPSALARSRLDFVPPLENGDHLDCNEFLRRYDAMPEVKKAELVEGIVYMASPVYFDDHGQQDSLAQTWLGTYAALTPGTGSATNSTTKLGPDDVPQPDGLLLIMPEFGGQSQVQNKILVGAPELGFEVAASSASLDNNAKKRSYEASGMREYLLWRTLSGELDWWKLEDGEFKPLEPGEDGIHRSEVFPGLWLDREAMLSMNSARVLEVLNLGLDSPEHAEFVEKLASAKAT